MVADADNPGPPYEFLRAEIDAGIPVTCYRWEQPITVFTTDSGEVAIDCPCLDLPGHERAASIRVQMTRETAHGLRKALERLEGPAN